MYRELPEYSIYAGGKMAIQVFQAKLSVPDGHPFLPMHVYYRWQTCSDCIGVKQLLITFVPHADVEVSETASD